MSLWNRIWGKKKKEKEENPEENKATSELSMGLTSRYLVVPYVSEKSLQMVKTQNIYTFLADHRLNKNQIKKIIRENFKVNPVEVRVINYPKRIRGAYRIKNKRRRFKKFLVKLKPGENLPFFEV